MIKLPIEFNTPECFDVFYILPKYIAKTINKPEGNANYLKLI